MTTYRRGHYETACHLASEISALGHPSEAVRTAGKNAGPLRLSDGRSLIAIDVKAADNADAIATASRQLLAAAEELGLVVFPTSLRAATDPRHLIR